MAHTFSKWDIVYATRFPESIKCSNCSINYTVDPNIPCTDCGTINSFTSLITKIRPVLIWIDKRHWFESMSFAIPLSTSSMISRKFNFIIKTSDYSYVHPSSKYKKPMRAAVHQSTRWDGNTILENNFIGTLTNQTLKEQIEMAMIDWVFPNK